MDLRAEVARDGARWTTSLLIPGITVSSRSIAATVRAIRRELAQRPGWNSASAAKAHIEVALALAESTQRELDAYRMAREDLERVVAELERSRKAVLDALFSEGLSQRDAALVIGGISQQRVQQLVKYARERKSPLDARQWSSRGRRTRRRRVRRPNAAADASR